MPPYEYCQDNSLVAGACVGLKLACSRNNVSVIVVLGHSDCKAMNLLYRIPNEISTPSKSPLSYINKFEKLQYF